MRKIATLIFLVTCNYLHAQIITSIHFEGLKKTKASYAAQFVNSKVGEPFDSVKLEADRQRLTNLETMTHVNIRLSGSADSVAVTFDCVEAISFLPIFGLGTIRNNYWAKLGAHESNLGGNGNKLIGYYQFYDRHSVSLYYASGRKALSPWTYTLNVVRWATLEPTKIDNQNVVYQYTNYQVGASILYHKSFTSKIEVALNVFYEEFNKAKQTELSPGPNSVEYTKALGRVSWQLNRMNYFYYYVSGVQNNLTFQTVRTFNQHIPFIMVVNELKYAKHIKKRTNLASRLRIGMSTNNNSPFAPFALDSYLNIRGVGNRVDRGTGAMVLNTELRHTVIEYAQFAIQTVVFSDAGVWRKPGATFSSIKLEENRRLFAGGGLRLIYKKAHDVIIRIDYGTEFYSTGGFVVGLGQYF